MALPAIDTACWSRDAATPMTALKSGPDGLCAAIAATKLATNGPKTMGETEHVNGLRWRLRRFESPLVLMLIFAALI